MMAECCISTFGDKMGEGVGSLSAIFTEYTKSHGSQVFFLHP